MDRRPVRELTDEELTAEWKDHRSYRDFISSRYIELDRERTRRANRRENRRMVAGLNDYPHANDSE